jgi:hypothetical protein
MNNIKITVEMSKEDRDVLQSVACSLAMLGDGQLLANSLTLLAAALGNKQPAEAQPTTTVEPVDVPAPAPAAEPAAVEPVPTEPAPEVKPVSLAEFQKAVTQAVAKGAKQKAAAKEIINKYAASVSAVPEEKRAEVIAELAKI